MAARIAFYAPLKPPDHPIASGDREIARNLVAALGLAGYDVEIASRAISYQKRPGADLFEARRALCKAEAERLIGLWGRDFARQPRAWLTYHPYCKAPDWIGPAVSSALGIPYLTAEAARTRQNSDADWAAGRAVVQDAIRRARVNFCLKPSDRDYLQTVLPDMRSVVALRPFLDASEIDAIPAPAASSGSTVRLVAVGMMRPGAKLDSYGALAAALATITELPWTLEVVGDGPERGRVETLFSPLGARVTFLGALPRASVLAHLKGADIFVWPGLHEAIGMVYLEASACGLPIVAFATAGVPIVVEAGVTGLLAPEMDIVGLGARIGRLIASDAERGRLGAMGRRKVSEEHGFAAAAATLKRAIAPLMAATGP